MKRQINFSIVFDREEDGRWIAEVPQRPGVMSYGTDEGHAASECLKLLADVIEDELHEEAREAGKGETNG